MEAIAGLMGYERSAGLESMFLGDEQLERKHGSQAPDDVIRART